MTHSESLSRRERQIMDVVYSLGSATVSQVHAEMTDPPTTMAIRRTMHILEEKGHLTRKSVGRAVEYRPKAPKRRAGMQALDGVLKTFFGGSLEAAVAAHLVGKNRGLHAEEKARLVEMIQSAREVEQQDREEA